MSVRIIEAGKYARAGEIDATGTRAGERQEILARADGKKSPVADCDRGSFGLRGIHGTDTAVVEHDIGLRTLEAHERQSRERGDEVPAVVSHGVLLFMLQ